jgi:ABC-type transport system involved in cytochrome bd biosynthesis fused ATPase/permease subunit
LIDLIGVPSGQVICLLYGPGGSGKSTVINLVVAYAKEYCKELKHPFTSRMIVVSAMSGVAATLLRGKTTHSALGLNRREPDAEMMDAWFDIQDLLSLMKFPLHAEQTSPKFRNTVAFL